MKDNFSIQARAYSQFRPHYPDAMIAYLMSFVARRDFALDVATGNGQLTVKLSPYFKTVHATDISEKQIANADKRPNIIYETGQAEQTGFPDRRFDLITVAQAVHWFDFERFYKEVYRILKPDGVFAVLGYGLISTNPQTDAVLSDFYYNIIGPYWDAERRYINEMYKTIPFPFEEIPARKFTNRFSWSFAQLTGYLETWSAVQHYKKANGTNPVGLIREKLRQTWGEGNNEVVFPLLLRIGKLKNTTL